MSCNVINRLHVCHDSTITQAIYFYKPCRPKNGLGLAACTTTIGGDGGSPDNGAPGNADAGQVSSTGECPGGEQAFTELMADVRGMVDLANAPGLALAILCDGKLAHTGVVGSVRANGAAIDENTRFQLASATKMFTAAAALRLAAEGTVALKSPISQYIPELAFGQINLEELLSHSSGFSTGFDSYPNGGLVDIVRANSSMELWSAPGAVWNYSNTGMAVVGAVLEVASGRSFSALVEEEVFAKAGMTSASMRVDGILASGNYAYGHEGNANSPRVVAPDGSYFGSGDYGPMGGAWGSVVDLAHWAEAHMADEDPLGSGLMKSLRTPQIRTTYGGQSYGLGHFIQDTTPASISHGGSTIGFLTDFTIYPESGFGVVVLSNSEWFDPSEIGRMAADKYLGELGYPAGPQNATKAELVGSYTSNVFGKITIRDGAQGLLGQRIHKRTAALVGRFLRSGLWQ